MRKINFFDLGAYDGMESLSFIEIMDEMGIDDYKIFSFEPCMKSFNQMQEILKSSKNVTIINAGIGPATMKSKLFHSFVGNEVGHSIFSSKHNVEESDFEEINLYRFSEWCLQENIDLLNALNVIKFNIEGAEWHLFNDLIDSGLIRYFQIFCGDGLDIYKIGELKDNTEKFEKMLTEHNINILPFSCQGYRTEQERINREKMQLKSFIIAEYEKL